MTAGQSPIDPTRLTPEQAAKLLSAAANSKITAAQIAADIAAGAERNQDGTLNLVHYAAWLVQQQS